MQLILFVVSNTGAARYRSTDCEGLGDFWKKGLSFILKVYSSPGRRLASEKYYIDVYVCYVDVYMYD